MTLLPLNSPVNVFAIQEVGGNHMALAVSLRVDFIDNKGKTSFTKFRVPSGRTLSEYTVWALAHLQKLLNISTGRITGASICLGIDTGALGLSTTASSVSNVGVKGAFRFNTSQSGFYAKTNIPALAESKVIAGSDNIDQSDADVIAYMADLTGGVSVTGGTMVFTNGRGHTITSIRTAKERFRRRSA